MPLAAISAKSRSTTSGLWYSLPLASGRNVPYVTPRIQNFSSPTYRNFPREPGLWKATSDEGLEDGCRVCFPNACSVSIDRISCLFSRKATDASNKTLPVSRQIESRSGCTECPHKDWDSPLKGLPADTTRLRKKQ